jgi:uncharacterized protein (TIGR00730 family)
MNRNICVYCSSSNAVDEKYFIVARQLGEIIAKNGDHLIYGGANLGLMGEVAKTVKANGGKVLGVLPRSLHERDLAFQDADEIIITETMRERKEIMDQRADVFIALPGGFGTLEELIEIITLKQLNYHKKPVIILNVDGFYQKLHELFEVYFLNKFANPDYEYLYTFQTDVAGTFDYIDNYVIPPISNKWFY